MRPEREEKLKGLRKLEKVVVCKSEELLEGRMRVVSLIPEDGTKAMEILVIRREGRLYAIGGTCIYDGESSLADAQLHGNKLMCTKHGCAYNIENG